MRENEVDGDGNCQLYGERLSATKLAEHFSSTGNKVSVQKMNRIIEEIGWIRGYSGGGYEPTKQGLRKDVLRVESQRGTRYCSYPPGIIHDPALTSRFADISPASARFSNLDIERQLRMAKKKRELKNENRERCPECPKSGGSEACPKCSPLNFCFLTEHGNSSDDAMSKDMLSLIHI